MSWSKINDDMGIALDPLLLKRARPRVPRCGLMVLCLLLVVGILGVTSWLESKAYAEHKVLLGKTQEALMYCAVNYMGYVPDGYTCPYEGQEWDGVSKLPALEPGQACCVILDESPGGVARFTHCSGNEWEIQP